MSEENLFAVLGLDDDLWRALETVGYVEPTPIQSQSIPILLNGDDLLGVAQTGTGKTAAFALPLLQRLASGRRAAPRRPRSLILAPTRELALQIHEQFEIYGQNLPLVSAVIFGGVGQNPQVKALGRGVDILVATPGRLLDLMGQRHVDLGGVEVLVLDEADRLLDMGFVRDVRRVISATPKSRQSLLFSATMPKEVAKLANDFLVDPSLVDVSPREITLREIEQRVVLVENSGKQAVLEKLLHDTELTRAIIFTRTKHGANRVAKKLDHAGIGAAAIHGNKSQSARQRALAGFKNGDVWALVATDIAARGLDIDAVSHVINFELPHEPESYVHRIGRTGRAGASGVAWSLVDPTEQSRLVAVEKLIQLKPARYDTDLELTAPAAQDGGDKRRAERRGDGAEARTGGSRRRGRGRGRGGNRSQLNDRAS